jgi:hypothetical protein
MKYRHYKGGIYELIAVVKHTETGEALVVYQDEKGNGWARPETMFFGMVWIDDRAMLRFTPIHGTDGDQS